MAIFYLIGAYLLLNGWYYLLFSIASTARWSPVKRAINKYRKVTILIPVYIEDKVILDSINSIGKLTYPKVNIQPVVLADSLQPKTLEMIRSREPGDSGETGSYPSYDPTGISGCSQRRYQREHFQQRSAYFWFFKLPERFQDGLLL